jgi:hypothetical protein
MRGCCALVLAIVVGAACASVRAAEDPNAPVMIDESWPAQEWDFDRHDNGFRSVHDCRAAARQGSLVIKSTGDDPYLICSGLKIQGTDFRLVMRARAKTAGPVAIYWGTDRAGIGEERRANISVVHDGQTREYETRFHVDGKLTDMRIDPGTAPGDFEIEWMTLTRWRLHPLAIEKLAVAANGRELMATIRNRGEQAAETTVAGKDYSIASGKTRECPVPLVGKTPLERVVVEANAVNLPALKKTVFVVHGEAEGTWRTLRAGMGKEEVRCEVAEDGSIARLFARGELAAVIGPIVKIGDRTPTFETARRGDAITLTSDAANVELRLDRNILRVAIDAREGCEGPCVRARGELMQAVFGGLEYLEAGDTSSSTLDVETDEHLRFAPERRKVTMPLMAVATKQANVALAWDDTSLQPVFASPNVYDTADDHRMALRGKKIRCEIRLGATGAESPRGLGGVEEAIAWAVKRNGLPKLPQPPRTAEAQRQLDVKALTGPLRTAEGWGHCIEPHWPRSPHSDMASTLWRLTGEVPQLPRLTPGGAHLRNDAAYFVTGRGEEWLAQARAEIKGHIAAQQADGSYRYDGKYRRGHFENTASGLCATHAARLLELARLTGDADALAAGRKTLDFMMRFRVPRGAQTWEVPLHTPDQLASGYLVWAFTRGYELTGEKMYLAEARRWALSGVPFTYLWSDRPVMLYATVPVLGATNWREPCWIGLPVQWCGGVYAYALTMLAPYDDTLDWKQLARGILIAAQQMQYPDGYNAGTLPDSFALADQQRRPWNINPCALVSLQQALDGKVDSLAVAVAEGGRRAVGPFAMRVDGNTVVVAAKARTRKQVLLTGSAGAEARFVTVDSKGDDRVELTKP